MHVGLDRNLDPTTGRTSAQRKTTLKWDVNGELTAVDMVRVIDRLTQPELARCDLDPS
jgi:hypothetical protein